VVQRLGAGLGDGGHVAQVLEGGGVPDAVLEHLVGVGADNEASQAGGDAVVVLIAVLEGIQALVAGRRLGVHIAQDPLIDQGDNGAGVGQLGCQQGIGEGNDARVGGDYMVIVAVGQVIAVQGDAVAAGAAPQVALNAVVVDAGVAIGPNGKSDFIVLRLF
jgi:hypothetical protein